VQVVLVFLLDAVDEVEEDAAAHVLQVYVEKGVVEGLGEVGDGLVNVGVGELLADVVDVVGDDAASGGAQGLGGSVACAAEGCLVEELANVRQEIFGGMFWG